MKLPGKLLIFFLLLFPAACWGQYSITGKIVDETGYPLAYSKIEFRHKFSGKLHDGMADSTGVFMVDVDSGKYHFKITSFGTLVYQKQIDIWQSLNLGTIKADTGFALQEIVIEGKKPIFRQEYDKFIFNVENSPLKQGYDALEVLKRSPKLQVNAQGDILLRSSSVLVLVNGRKMNMTGDELINYLSSINSENIKSIEIQQVGASETDASSSGGVVNIVLKKIPTGFQSTLRTSYTYRNQDNQAYFGGITTQFGAAKWNIYNKFSYRDDRNFSRYNSTMQFYNTQGKNENEGCFNSRSKNFNTTTGIVFYPSSKHVIGTEFYYSNSASGRNGTEHLQVYDPGLTAAATNQSGTLNQTGLWNAILNYTYQLDSLGSKIKLIADLGKNSMDNRNEVDTRYSTGYIANNQNMFLSGAVSDFHNVQADWNQKTKQKFEFNVGAKLSGVSRQNRLNTYLYGNTWELTPAGQEDFKNRENVMAGYVNIATAFKKKHQLKIGLRTEYTDLKGTDYIHDIELRQKYLNWFPSLFYGYEIKENNNLSFSYARRIQRPGFRDLNPFVIKQNDFLYQTGNPLLQPQYTHNADISLQQAKQSFSLYGSYTNDVISGVYTAHGNISYYKPQNFGSIRILGGDYSFYGDINKWLYTNISVGGWHYDLKVQGATHDRLIGYVAAYTQVKFTKTFFLDIYNNFTSKNQSSVSEGAEQYRLDLSLQKKAWHDAVLFRFTCEDVFNTERDKNLSRYSQFDFRFYHKRLTRSFMFMIVYTFKNKGKFDPRNVEQESENKGRL